MKVCVTITEVQDSFELIYLLQKLRKLRQIYYTSSTQDFTVKINLTTEI